MLGNIDKVGLADSRLQGCPGDFYDQCSDHPPNYATFLSISVPTLTYSDLVIGVWGFVLIVFFSFQSIKF